MEKLLQYIQSEIERVESVFLTVSQQLGKVQYQLGMGANGMSELDQPAEEDLKRQEIHLRDEKQYLNVYHQKLLAIYNMAQDAASGDVHSMPQATNGDVHSLPQATMERLSLMINAQEAERLRLSRQIHDGPAQSLANFILRAEISSRLMDKDVDKAREELKGLKEAANKTLQEVRDTIFELRPMMLDDLGLSPTTEKYIETLNARHGNKIVFEANGGETRFERALEVMVFRSLQELITSVLKQPSVTSVSVKVTILGHLLVVEVNDDGSEAVNMDMSDPNNFSMLLLRNRVLEFGGRFDMRTLPQGGSEVVFAIPISPVSGILAER